MYFRYLAGLLMLNFYLTIKLSDTHTSEQVIWITRQPKEQISEYYEQGATPCDDDGTVARVMDSEEHNQIHQCRTDPHPWRVYLWVPANKKHVLSEKGMNELRNEPGSSSENRCEGTQMSENEHIPVKNGRAPCGTQTLRFEPV